MKRLLLVAALALTAPACNTSDYATPDEAARRTQLESEWEAAAMSGDSAAAATAKAELAELDRMIAERTTGGWLGVALPFIPAPLRPYAPFLATLLFPRVRRQALKTVKDTGKAIKEVAKLNPKGVGSAVGEALDSALSVVGWTDSRKDTAAEMLEHAAEMRAAGDGSGAALLEQQAAAIQAKAAATA